MKNLVELHDKEPRAGSKLLATGFGTGHKAFVELIRTYRLDFFEFGCVEIIHAHKKLAVSNGELWDEFVSSTSGKRGDNEYWLNEDQATFAGTLTRNSETSVAFKKALVKDYSRCKKLLSQIGQTQSTEEWQQARIEGKTDRRIETDGIKAFIEYAKAQGSESADMYYISFTRMENAALFVVAGKFKNLRDVMTSKQLRTIGVCDTIIERAIADGIKQGLPYKEVYQLVKTRVISFAALYGKSEVVQKMLEGKL
jgi:hypothetical protein